VLLLLSSNQKLFSNFKGFGDFSGTLFMYRTNEIKCEWCQNGARKL